MAEVTVREALDEIRAALDKTRIPGELVALLRNYGVPHTQTPLDNTSRFMLRTCQGVKPATVALSIEDRQTGAVVWNCELGA